MARCLGVVVSGDKITLVDAEVPAKGPLEILADDSWSLSKGDRSAAYNLVYKRFSNYLEENKIERVIIKESALSRAGMRKSNLSSAELRGVVMAACASVAETSVLAKGTISKTFGDRKVDEYLADDDFWTDELSGIDIRIGSREAAMILLASRKKK